MLENSLLEIVNFEIPVFEDPTVHTCIIKCSKKNKTIESVSIKNIASETQDIGKVPSHNKRVEEILQTTNYVIDIYSDDTASSIIKQMKVSSDELGSICYIRQCIKTGDDSIYVSKSPSIRMKEPWKASLRGKSIGRYFTVETDLYLKYGDWLARNWKNKTFYETPKIAIRETGNRITATIDLENRYFLSSLYAIYYKKPFRNEELKFLLGIINSNLVNYFMKIIALNLTKGAFTKVRTNQLARLPIKKINPENPKENKLFDSIVDQVDTILSLHEERKQTVLPEKLESLQQRINHSDDRINQLVYQLYGLNDEEIAIVEGR